MKSYFSILLILCLTGMTLSSNLSRNNDSFLSGMFSKIKSFFGIGPKVIGDSEPVFKNLPFEVDRRVGIEIIKTAAKSPETVPDPIKVLDTLIQEYTNKREGATVHSVKSFFGLLRKLIDETRNLNRILPEALDEDVCIGGSKERCLFQIFRLEENWNRISKQADNLMRFMPGVMASSKNISGILKEIYRSVHKNRNSFKAFYLKIAELANSRGYSGFGQFMRIKSLMENQLYQLTSNMLNFREKEDYIIGKLYTIHGDITMQMAEAELLRSYLTEDVKGLKLSDIIYLFKERVQEFRKRRNDKHKPVMPVIDELPELEGIELNEIEDEKQMEAFKAELKKNKSLKEIEKDLPPKDSRGFFGRLVGVLTFGCGGD